MSILIKQALLNGKRQDILTEGSKIKKIADSIAISADFKIDAQRFAAIPSFFNGHTHAAMTLFRGYADDMQLDEWLKEKIWPIEAKLTEKDVYAGARLACLEMIKTGTTFFNDMYWHFHSTAKAAEEMGLRADVSAVMIDLFDQNKRIEEINLNKRLFAESRQYSGRIRFSLGPHAIYTVSEESLIWAKEFAEKNDALIHFHLSETEKEVDDCIKAHGLRPVEYLDKIGFLSPRLVACHSVWLSDREISLLKKHDVKIVYNPVSNMKLSVGSSFRFNDLHKSGLTMALGTDGCASNNNLDMLEEMKFAAVKQKFAANSPVSMTARDAFHMATKGGAMAFRLDAGELKEGMLADLLLVDLKHHSLVPNNDIISNLVYSGTSECIDTTICDGKILMRGRKVMGEESIIDEAEKAAKSLFSR